MKSATRRWIVAGAITALWIAPAGAQDTQPAVPAVTDAGESMDSGVGDLQAETWIGKPVMSSDGREIGRLKEVQMASDTTDGGRLMVERENAMVEVPMAGASFDGTNVVVTPLYDAVVAN